MFKQDQKPAGLGYQLTAVVFCTIFLLLPSIFNRAPFVYFDSASYLSQAGKAVQMLQSRIGIMPDGSADAIAAGASLPKTHHDSNDINYAGRSIYYSLFAWIGAVTLGASSVGVLQAAVLASLIVMTLQAVWPNASAVPFLMATVALAAGLALLTSAGFFVGLIMPDIWAGMMILAFALLMTPSPGIGRNGRVALAAILTLAAAFHISHLLLLATMVGLLALAMLLPGCRRIVAPGRVVLPALALACGLAGHVAFSVASIAATGQPPLTRPFVTAHLIEMGPGTRMIQNTCPNSGFAICPYVDRLPTDWISFMFSRDPQTGVFGAVPPSVQRALSEEQTRFALASFAAEPLATTGGLLRDGVAQLWQLSVDDVPLSERNEAFLAANFTQEVAALIRGSAIWSRPWVAPALSKLIQASTALAAIGLLALVIYGRVPRHGPMATLFFVCITGLVLNALICGMLASPYGRFQARISWLLPFLLIIALFADRFPNFVASKEETHDNQ
ncbi:MAG: hypothetical protein ACK4GC_06775 [Paracoccaceae bacterium]